MLIIYMYNQCAQGDGWGLQVRGCGTMWGAFIYCITEKMTVQRCFVLVSITPVFFPSLVSAFFPHLNYCLMLRFFRSLCHYMPLCSKVNMWSKPKYDGINPLA